jgi:hypothetical protein
MKSATEYQQKDGTYDYDQVIIDAFNGDAAQYEEFLRLKLNCSIDGTEVPKLPEPYEALYQQVYALQLKWVEAHMPQLRREHRNEYGFYPIVATEE